MSDQPLVQLADIEVHKENIQPLAQGRSAQALVKAFASTGIENRDGHQEQRLKFETQIADADELDDPIQPYLDYIRWTVDTYPQGNSTDSGLVVVLEQCTSKFRDAAFYKDDSRYLRVWMQYAQYSDSPKEIFTYLARKEIGQNLSLFYEEYANYLESTNRKNQANEVYQLGLQMQARPIERLKRRYNEFCQRLSVDPPTANEPNSPVMPVVRPALALKDGGLAPLEDSVAAPAAAPHQRLQVFNDPFGQASGLPKSTGGWDSLGSLASRRKENEVAAQSWAGQTMPSSTQAPAKSSLSVFKDPTPSTASAPVPGRRDERIAIAVEFLHDENGEEYCLEEMLARARGITPTLYKSQQEAVVISETPLNHEPTQVVPRSPTMTFHTKAATDEIYEMFNQSLKADSDSESSNGYSDDEGDGIEDEDNDAHDQLAETFTGRTGNELAEPVNTQAERNYSTPSRNPAPRKVRMPFMTPIAESTEVATPYSDRQPSPEAQPIAEEPSHPQAQLPPVATNDVSATGPVVVNAAEQSTRLQVWPTIESALEQFGSYHRYSGSVMAKKDSFRRMLSTKLKPTEKAVANLPVLQLPSDMFCLRRLLGEGGFGSVFLAESEAGDLKAIKAETTAIPWEFYMLKSVHEQMGDRRESASIIQADALYAFDDEQYMVLEYAPQGTLLDAVNIANSINENGGIDERAAMFFAIELIRCIESLHTSGIIHGDLKPENIMIRLPEAQLMTLDKKYHPDGSSGWSRVGITLVDFGRSIDTKLFGADVKYTADWKVDEQDCIEMRKGLPWTYQTDYHGIACVLHLVLFGKFLKSVEDLDASGHITVRVSAPLKRYWQKDLWSPLFELLLNSGRARAPQQQLGELRRGFEQWLHENCEAHGSSLKLTLVSLEQEMRQSKKHIK